MRVVQAMSGYFSLAWDDKSTRSRWVNRHGDGRDWSRRNNSKANDKTEVQNADGTYRENR